MEELRAFDILAERPPGPAARTALVAHAKFFFGKGHGKMVFERGGAAVYGTGQYKPERDHQRKPKKRTGCKRQGRYTFKIKQGGRSKGKHIDQYDHKPDFAQRYKMVPQGLYHLVFVIGKMDGHADKRG